MDTSISTGTSLLLSVAVGFVVAGLVSLDRVQHKHSVDADTTKRYDDTDLTQMMEPAK